MKKSFTIVLVIALCAVLGLTAVGCSGGGSGAPAIEGVWNLSKITDPDGNEMSGEEIAAVMGDTYYDFQSGGKLVAGTAGMEVEGKWKQDGNKVTIESDGQSFEASVDGTTMTLEANGATSVFTKK